jgi:hypothetical protein
MQEREESFFLLSCICCPTAFSKVKRVSRVDFGTSGVI